MPNDQAIEWIAGPSQLPSVLCKIADFTRSLRHSVVFLEDGKDIGNLRSDTPDLAEHFHFDDDDWRNEEVTSF